MTQSNDPDPAFRKQLLQDGVIDSNAANFTLLTGGVSSEIYCVEDHGKRFVIKRALEKLRVSADWFADVSRNAYEVAFLEYVAEFVPESVPKILASGEGYFVMEFIGGSVENWKELLLAGICDRSAAEQAGEVLGVIHRHSFHDGDAAKRFDSSANFIQLRIEPYLLHTAEKYPDIASILIEEADRLVNTCECLIHGDFSPKNILVSPSRMVLVDCEVAYYGDPVFDISFLLSHLFLKGLYHAPIDRKLQSLVAGFMGSYKNEISKKNNYRACLSRRVCRLLPMLILARVDGKSPVEYLDLGKKEFVRDFALHQIKRAHFELEELIDHWFEAIFLVK